MFFETTYQNRSTLIPISVLTFYTLKIYSLVDQKCFCGFFLPGCLTAHLEKMPESIALTIIIVILVTADIVGNSLVCLIVKKHRDMRYQH